MRNKPTVPQREGLAKAQREDLAKALDLLHRDIPVAIATETVYGLAANACSDRAVAAVFALKQRPAFNPLIAHFYDPAQLGTYIHLTPLGEKLLQAFTPGPLTLVLAKKKDAPVSDLVTAGLDTLAVRIPSHPTARALIKSFGKPLAAPSANPSETLSPTSAAHVREAFQEASSPPFILDGGPCQKGLESTIIDARFEFPILLRPGSLSVESLEAVLGCSVLHNPDDPHIRSPGQLKHHYAPNTPLKLNVTSPDPQQPYLAFGELPPAQRDAPQTHTWHQLSASGDLEEAATNLFAMLRALDHSGGKILQVAPIPEKGLGLAINDRLKRASVR